MTEKDLYQLDLSDMRILMNTREGVRFFSMLLELCGIYRTSYNGEETHAMAFKEGARNVGLKILSMLDKVDDTARLKLMKADRERTVTRNEE